MYSLGQCPRSLSLQQTNLQLQLVRGLWGKCLAWKTGRMPGQMNTTVCINEGKTSKLLFLGPVAWAVRKKNAHSTLSRKGTKVCGFDEKQQWTNVAEEGKKKSECVQSSLQSFKHCRWPETSETRGVVSRYLWFLPGDSLSNWRSL